MGQPSEVIKLVMDRLGEMESIHGIWVFCMQEHRLELGEEATAAWYG
jgi:hypothetical protein